MEITFSEEMGIPEILQAIYERLHEIEDKYGIRYSLGITLYLNPSNGFGDRVTIRKKNGKAVRKLRYKGAYKSAADDFKL